MLYFPRPLIYKLGSKIGFQFFKKTRRTLSLSFKKIIEEYSKNCFLKLKKLCLCLNQLI